jgi:hypothetical protein
MICGEECPAQPKLVFSICLTAVHNHVIMYGRSETMDEMKLTVRVPRDLVTNVKLYAAQNHTTLTDLIEAYLRRIPVQQTLTDAPIVRRLSGTLPKSITRKDYIKHQEEKYGQ